MKTRTCISALLLAVAAVALMLISSAAPAFAATKVVRSVSELGGTPTASYNDFELVDAAIFDADPGDIIKFVGTFDFSEPFAQAEWAKGRDGVAGNDDDYAIYAVPGVNNVTLTANALGNATFKGPGDLASTNLEGLFLFDGGDNQNWTISNLRILDFDLSIGFFNGAGGTDAFNGTVISNNYFLIPNDLNTIVAAADPNQNIGLHFSFGSNQTITRNVFDVPGDGVSDPSAGADFWTFGLSPAAPYSSTVVMQSNTSGGNAYDGLKITYNKVRILNAQNANPARIIGYWENGHAHSSNVTVSYNSFENLAGGNDPLLNRQIAFRPTSHSSATTTVTFANNVSKGASVGFGPMDVASGVLPLQIKNNLIENASQGLLTEDFENYALSNNTFSNTGGMLNQGTAIKSQTTSTIAVGTQAGSNFISGFNTGINVASGTVTVLYTAIRGNGTGIAVGGGTAVVNYSDISGNTTSGIAHSSGPTVDATKNWWGSNTGPGTPNNGTSGSVTTAPFAVGLADTVTASTHEIGEASTLDTNITVNNLYGAQLQVNHDNAVVSFTSGTEHDVASTPPWVWDQVVELFEAVTGGRRLSGTMQAPTHTVGANLTGQSIATWNYSCAAVGTSTLMYDNTTGTGTLLSSPPGVGSTQLLAALIGNSINCTAATAASTNGIIKLQGRVQGATTPAGWNGATVVLTCTSGDCLTAAAGPYFFEATNVNGEYQLVKTGPGTGVALGTYSASVTRRAYLGATKATSVVIAAGTNVINAIGDAPTLLGGELADDGDVDVSDLAVVAGSFGNSVTADTGPDINGDGFVNIFDLVLVGGNFGATTSTWN